MWTYKDEPKSLAQIRVTPEAREIATKSVGEDQLDTDTHYAAIEGGEPNPMRRERPLAAQDMWSYAQMKSRDSG